LASEDRQHLLAALRASRERLLGVVAGVSEEQFKRRPAVEAEVTAGDWSIAEVLAHLLASEQRRCARLEALLRGESSPDPEVSDEERNTEARQGRAVPVPQVIHGLLAARRRLERTLGVEDDAITARGPDLPPGVIDLVRADVIAHEEEHRRQIEAVKQALGAARPARG
jgi:uncharacterized damage-inducible protein DinB